MTPQTVYLEHESWLRTVVRSRLNEPEAVEDVMQNIAMSIVRQRHMLLEVKRIGAWLYQIAIRQILMYRRSTGRRRRFQERLAEGHAAAGGCPRIPACPEDLVMAAETKENVQRALLELTELDRQMLMLKYAEKWSYRQLADHLGVREDTVEYRLLRARRNLKRILMQLGEEGVSQCG